MSNQQKEFGKLRSFLWPIHSFELKKLLPMMLMLFLICINYSILRNLKDVIVVTAQYSGAEVIPFIKVWVMLPMAILSTVIFTKLTNRYSQEKVFYFIISFFLLFFTCFAFVIFPYHETFHPHEWADTLEQTLPSGFKGLIAMLRNWSFTLFYVICELWGSIVLSVLFWGFANEITQIKEARRFYGMLSVIASSAAIFAGILANFLTTENWDESLRALILFIIGSGCLTMITLRWMDLNVLRGPRYAALHQPGHPLPVKKKLSMRESMAFLSRSKYLLCIAALVLCYNLIINLVEIVWKDQLKQLYPAPVDYSRYMNHMTTLIGIIATVTSLFISQMISRIGWTRTALITPIAMLLISAGFFSFMLFKTDLEGPMALLFGTTPLAIAVFLGASDLCISKACKYSLFDATKEMTFIPLEHDYKLKGKAAIDGIGSRLGKSGGSVIYQGLLVSLGSLSMTVPYVALILFLMIGGWIIAVRSLGKQFVSLVGEKSRAEIGETDTVVVKVDQQDTHSQKSAEVAVTF